MATKEDPSSDSDHDQFEDALEEIQTNSSRHHKTNPAEGKGKKTEDGSGSSEHQTNQKPLDMNNVKNDDVTTTELLTGEMVPKTAGNQEMKRNDGTEDSFFDSTTNIQSGQSGEVNQCSEDNHHEEGNKEGVTGNKTVDESQNEEMTANKNEEEYESNVFVEEGDDARNSGEMEEVTRDDDINPKPFTRLSERLNERETEAWEQAEDEAAAVEEDEEKEEEIFVDEEYKKEMEKDMTEEEKETRRLEAADLKAQGNEHFKKGDFTTAMQTYTQALVLCPLCYEQDRAIMYSNRAACRVKLEENEMAVEDCSKALELQPDYVRALLRRAQTYEGLEKLDEALTDYQRVVELDRSCHVARAACMRLPDEIKERNEKMKAEMMDKLKDLGNMVLRPFGLSTANFRVDQNPDSGSYNIQFVQNPNNNDE
ncbi:uncharacterized protein LOC144910278 [Branchiostoma floridae x Branchiostoma belcheri]